MSLKLYSNISKWIEYNFKMSGEENDFVKELGSKNKVFIIRSLTKVIPHFIEEIKNIFKETLIFNR